MHGRTCTCRSDPHDGFLGTTQGVTGGAVVLLQRRAQELDDLTYFVARLVPGFFDVVVGVVDPVGLEIGHGGAHVDLALADDRFQATGDPFDVGLCLGGGTGVVGVLPCGHRVAPSGDSSGSGWKKGGWENPVLSGIWPRRSWPRPCSSRSRRPSFVHRSGKPWSFLPGPR